jgi:hypothetical protein
MRTVVLKNPVINLPFVTPARHFRLDEDGITNEILNEGRFSLYIIPIPWARIPGHEISDQPFKGWPEHRGEENMSAENATGKPQ